MNWTHAQALAAVATTEYAQYYTNGRYDEGCEQEQHEELVGLLEDLGMKPPAPNTRQEQEQKKVPALIKRVVAALMDSKYFQPPFTLDQAQDMISNEGVEEVALFVNGHIAAYNNKSVAQETTKVTVTPSEDKSMALVIEHNADGTKKSIKTIDTGYGVQSARPLPEVKKEAKPTVVEPAVQISSKPTPNEQPPKQELVYDYHKLPTELQRIVDDISLHKVATTTQLPVLHIVGWNQDEMCPIYKCTAGMAALNAYLWCYTTEPHAWQNIPAIVVAPTDTSLRKIIRGYFGHDLRVAEASYKLICCGSLKQVATLDMQQFAKVVAPPSSEPKATAKGEAKARKANAKVEVEAPAPTKAKEDKKAPAITEDLLQELAVATNHMKKISLVNKILVALGEPKVEAKCTKADLQPTIERLLKTLGVVPVASVKEEKAPAKAKTKAAKEPKLKAPTKGAIEAFYVEQLVRETGCTAASAKKQFKGVDVKWTSSIERAEYAQNLGMTLEVA